MTSARERGASLRRCDRALDAAEAAARRWSLWVPGRIEVLGKHTDYGGGRSILCALERGFIARVSARRDRLVRVMDVAGHTTFETTLAPDATGDPGHWSQYVATVARRLSRDMPTLSLGVDVAFLSNLPVAAGMSSSSALLIMAYMAIARANALEHRADFRRAIRSRNSLGAYLGAVENGRPFGTWRGDVGVGTFGGNQDQVAILCGEPGRLVRFGWSPVQRQGAVRLPDGYVFALASSGIAAPKTASAMARYNRASLALQRITTRWNARHRRRHPTLFDALSSGPNAMDGLLKIARSSRDSSLTAAFLTARLEQFAEETFEIIPKAWDALGRGAVAEFGALVDRSQFLAQRRLGNQVPETIALQRHARALGAPAASAFGAGFGGSVWALVRARGANEFIARWRARYLRAYPRRANAAEFFLSRAGSPAAWL